MLPQYPFPKSNLKEIKKNSKEHSNWFWGKRELEAMTQMYCSVNRGSWVKTS